MGKIFDIVFRNLSKQSIYIFQIFSKIGFLATGLLINRWLINYLSTDEYAIYNIVNDSLIPFITVFLTLSVSSLIQKYYTNNTLNVQNRDLFANMWMTFSILRFVTFGLGIIMLSVLNSIFNFADINIILLLFTTHFIILFDWNYRAVCDATGRTWMFNLTDLLTKASVLLLLYGVIIMGVAPSLILFCFILLFGTILNLLFDIYIHRQYVFWGKFDWNILRGNMRPMITLSITSIITYFYLFSFQINLSFFNIEQLDINNFSNAYNRLFLTFISVPAIIMPNLATRLTWLLQKKEYKKSLRMIYGIIGLSIVYFFIYKLTVPIVFNILDPNNLYPGTIPLTHVLSFGILFYPIIQILSPLFIFFHKEKYELFVAIILAILGLGLQLTVIPDFGILGLAYVILITITMDFLLKGLLFSRIIIGLVRKKS